MQLTDMMTRIKALFLLAALLASMSPGHALPPLPEGRANNPFVRVESGSAVLWFTGLGLAAGKTYRDLRADGWILSA